jgi:hypothetical protein
MKRDSGMQVERRGIADANANGGAKRRLIQFEKGVNAVDEVFLADCWEMWF